MSHRPIGFAGLTHLGTVSAIATAAKGVKVIGYDPDSNAVDQLRSAILPVVEPGLPELLQKAKSQITFTSDLAELGSCGIIYIAADVPTDENGVSDLTAIEKLIAAIEPQLADDAILVVLSQVPPGFTRKRTIAKERLFYQVETLIFGRAVERATAPERFIVGCSDPQAPLPENYKTFLALFDCPILPMRYESAELAKISINVFLVASVSATNTMAELCEHAGADWAEIAPALRLDKRIGPHAYLKPGLGIAGGNLERDLATVLRMSEKSGSDAGVIRSFLANSNHRRNWVYQMLQLVILEKKPNAVIALLGLAYKENTHSTKNSPALQLLANIPDCRVQAFDPVVKPDPAWHPDLTAVNEPLEVCENADVIVIATPWPQFGELEPTKIAAKMSGQVMLDPYAVLNAKACETVGLHYYSLGVPPLHSS